MKTLWGLAKVAFWLFVLGWILLHVVGDVPFGLGRFGGGTAMTLPR